MGELVVLAQQLSRIVYKFYSPKYQMDKNCSDLVATALPIYVVQ